MKRLLSIFLLLLLTTTCVMAKKKTVTLKFIETTDVHGSFMPYDYINRREKRGSLARVDSYVKAVRADFGENLILLENGDLLQGQPICYYYNYIATDKENIGASLTNYMGYDVQAFGNHDVETGHACYDKWVSETKATVLGANIVDTKTGKPYVEPYKVIYRDGVKIVILGMCTAAIPSWLEESIWSGLHFENMIESSKKWVKYIQENEKPDVLVGLFHAGREGGIVTEEYSENPTEQIAREVPGFDIIFYGHDHQKFGGQIDNINGSKVWILDPANNALNVAEAEVTLNINDRGKKGVTVLNKQITGKIVNIENQPVSEDFMRVFAANDKEVREYINRPIGSFTETIYTRDSFFGSCPFNDLIHNMQLALTDAQISFAAPLAFNAKIDKGELHVSDMFNLYRFENKLAVLMMTGDEIRRHLEMSYDMWVNTMTSKDDHIMRLKNTTGAASERSSFEYPTFNFDSAAGIDYEVDVTKPAGERVKILRLSNGEAFDLNKMYKVAMNSYRANGGGELLTRGAGLTKDEIERRTVWKSEKDLRFYLMQEIEKRQTINPQANNNWRFVPEELTKPALERDYKLLFP